MELYERANNIKEFLQKKISYTPEIAIVLGTGLGKLADEIDVDFEIAYKDIEGFPVTTNSNHEGKLIFGTLSGKKIVAMKGRIHLYEGYSTDDVTLPVRVFQLLGVKTYIVTNSSGAINTNFESGDLMLITDHISFFCPSPLWCVNDDRFGERFPSMDNAYDKDLISLSKKAAKNLGIDIKEGIYCYCKGAMFETPAEIRALSILGADAVGMSTVPEVISAVHSGLKVLGIATISNMASGILDKPLTYNEIIKAEKTIEKKITPLIKEIVSLMD